MQKAFCISILTLISFSAFAQQKKLPNIIIIYADDLGYGDLSCYGGDIPTPNIDKIGKEGIRFTDFYVSAPVCTPSRFSLLTGSYPGRSQHRLTSALMPFDKKYLDKSETTLAEYLKPQGYNTALMGKWHLGEESHSDLPTRHGFDVFYGLKGGCIDYFYHTYGKLGPDWYVNGKPTKEEGFSTDLITRHATDYIQRVKQTTAPFFLYLAYNAPHYGKSDPDNLPDNTVTLQTGNYKGYEIANTLQVPKAYLDKFSHVKDPYRRIYSAMVSNLDDNVGELMNKLKAEGLIESTMIWFISDNGGSSESLHGHASNGDLRGEKGTLWEGGIRVPALVSWPGKIKASQVINAPVCNVDIVPTLASIAGFGNALPKHLIDGKDITDILLDRKTTERDIIWNFRKQAAIRRGAWKLLSNGNIQELYNLETDKSEIRDLAVKYPAKVKELQERFDKIHSSLKQVSDPVKE